MPKLWVVDKTDYGDPILYPASMKLEVRKQAIALAKHVPGANVNMETGEVTGQAHALRTVLGLAKQADRVGPPPSVTTTRKFNLPEYQDWGRIFIADQLEQGVMCNDDVGLGKTVQTIAALATVSPHPIKIILCPAFLRAQWKGELEKWWKTFTGSVPNVHVLFPPSDRRSKLKQEGTPDFIVAYYLDAQRAVELVKGYTRRGYYLVIDEVHNIRGYKTKRLEEVKAAATFAVGKVSLTASLLYNDAARLFPILDFTQPGGWGHFYDFARRYAGAVDNPYGGIELGGLTNVEELRSRLKDMSFRRVKEDVADQLPFDTKYQTLWLDPPSNMGKLLAEGQRNPMAFASMNSQLALAKIPAIIEQINSDVGSGIPSITFTYLKSQAEEIAARVPNSIVLHGDNSNGSNRLAKLNDYLSRCRTTGNIPVLVATMDAMGEGANLQWAKAINIAAIDPTPDKTRQAIGRAARMGQTGTVLIRLFAVKYSYDERLIEIVRGKIAENFKLDGRKEKAKSDLDTALSPGGQRDVLKEMLEKYKNEEGS